MGCGVIGGVFFAFSTFVMKALARLPAAQGIAAMQSINVVVLNPLFLAPFLGTAFVCVIVVILTLGATAPVGSRAGGVLYVIGTFLVTMAGNVPLNNRLARVDANSPEGASFWRHYVARWTVWNHVRTLAALLACIAFILAAD